MTEPLTIAKLRSMFGGNVGRDTRGDTPNRLPRWTWQVTSSTAETVVCEILPYLVGKRDQGELALEYRSQAVGRGRQAEADAYYRRMRATKNYNRKGENDEQEHGNVRC